MRCNSLLPSWSISERVTRRSKGRPPKLSGEPDDEEPESFFCPGWPISVDEEEVVLEVATLSSGTVCSAC